MSETQAVKRPLSATAIRQDGYDRLAFASAVAQVPELRKIARSGSARDLLSDVHASLFKLRPKVLDAEQTQSAHRDVIAEAMDTQEYARLRATTRMDELASALGTVELGTALAAALPEEPPQPPQDPQGDPGDPGAGRPLRPP